MEVISNAKQGAPAAGKRRLLSIQALRAIAALTVVFSHFRGTEELVLPGRTLLPSWTWVGFAAVNLFFVMSGFVTALSVQAMRGGYRDGLRFLWSRCSRILPPYWLYTALLIVPAVLAPATFNTVVDLPRVLSSALLWPQGELPILMVGWTLVHEAYFYLIAALALWIVPRRHHTLCLGGWAAVTMALNIYATDAWPAWLNLLASPFTLEFIVGIMLGKYWRCLPSSLALPAICVAAIILATAAMGSSILDPSYGHHPGRVAILGIVSILVVLSLVQLEASSRITPPAALVAIGNWSFSIGLSHIFVTSMMARVWRRLGPEMPLATQAVSLAAFVAASLLIGWASYRYLEQPFARWSKVMAFPRPHVAPR